MKIICFSSHTAIWHFAFAEAVVASALQKKGHEVLFITSGNQFAKISNQLQGKILRKEFSLNGYEIGDKLKSNDYKKINFILSKLNKNNFKKLKISGVSVGKIALYEYLLERKKINTNFNDEEWKECLIRIKNTLISLFASRLIISQEKPDVILVYNSLYSVNRAWEKYANQKNIPVYFLHNGLNLSDLNNTLFVAKHNPFHYFDNLKKNWSKLKLIPISQKEISYVTDHFFELLKAKHFLVYSAPKSLKKINIKKIFNIKDGQKILTVTMSSYDEFFAAQYVEACKRPKDLIFLSQVEWIEALINYVKNKRDLFLIIRVHPREFPNKRESVKSEHVKTIEKKFRNLPNNVKINWPPDNISIYDLAQETDVFLNAWSTVGVEMSLLGIPVVLYSKDITSYPSDLNYVGKNKKDYFSKIELALKDGWSYKKIKKTYRWLALYYYHPIIRFRKKIAKPKKIVASKKKSIILNYFYNLFSPKTRLFISNTLAKIPGSMIGEKQKFDCKEQLKESVNISNLEKMLMESGDTLVDVKKILKSKITNKNEDKFIHNEIKRVYKALYGKNTTSLKIKKNSLQHNLRKIIVK